MSRPFLFGGSSSGQSQSRYLVEFRAGKMTQNGTTVSPLKNRKGLVYLNQSDDSLMHFCWKDRQSGNTEDDLIIFPEEAEFKKVSQCTTGRVFVLRFKASSRRLFYWMQEPTDDKDDEFCNKINEYLNNPPAPGTRGGSGALSPGSALSDLSGIAETDLQGLLNNMTPQQLMSVLGPSLGGMNSASSLASILGAATRGERSSSSSSTPAAPQTPSTTPASISSAASESNISTAPAIQLSDLQSIISGLTVPPQAKESDVNVDLSSSITLDALQPLLSNQEFMSRVRDALPSNATDNPSGNVSEQFASTIQSPQFQQALSTFSAALQSGELGPLIQQFGLGQACVDAANAGDLESFVRGLQMNQQKTGDSAGEKKDDKKDDDDMALD